MKLLWLAVVSSLFLAGCAATNQLPPQPVKVDRIQVEMLDYVEYQLEISDSYRIEQVITLVNRKSKGWAETSSSPSAGSLLLKFYNGDRFAGNFYIGDDYFRRDYGQAFKADASREEVLAFEQALGFKFDHMVDPKQCEGDVAVKLRKVITAGSEKSAEINMQRFDKGVGEASEVCEMNFKGTDYRIYVTDNETGSFYIKQAINRLSSRFFGPFN